MDAERANHVPALALGATKLTRPLMPEVTDPGEDHGHVVLVSRGDHFAVPKGTARLNGAGRARLRRRG